MPISVHRIALGSDYTQVVDKVQKKKIGTAFRAAVQR